MDTILLTHYSMTGAQRSPRQAEGDHHQLCTHQAVPRGAAAGAAAAAGRLQLQAGAVGHTDLRELGHRHGHQV